jgi:hypothetical protein
LWTVLLKETIDANTIHTGGSETLGRGETEATVELFEDLGEFGGVGYGGVGLPTGAIGVVDVQPIGSVINLNMHISVLLPVCFYRDRSISAYHCRYV